MQQKPAMSRRDFLLILAAAASGLVFTSAERALAQTGNSQAFLPLSPEQVLSATTDTPDINENTDATRTPRPTATPTRPPRPTRTATSTLTSPAATATNTATTLPNASATATSTRTPTGATVHTYTDGYGGNIATSYDVLLNGGFPNLHLGEHGNFKLSPNQRELLKFNLSAIPATATCLSATLYLVRSYAPEAASTAQVQIYSVSAANASWVEGETSNPAYSGLCCWACKVANGVGGVTTPWAGSAGLGTAGTDYEPTLLGTISVNANNPIGTIYSGTLSTSRIQRWFGAVNTNYGLLMVQSAFGGHVGQSDNSTPAYRPKLVVRYAI